MKSSDQNELLNLYFLGPKGEQRKLFQEMMELINNDMVFWRRNFHPKDPPSIPYRNISSPLGQEYQEHLIQSLVQLLADLKMDLPFFSPRYLAHMTADLTLPGLLGYYAGLLYNANNVSGEASPVTLKYELEVGRQFARLFGYDEESSFGHITSGGTVANFESVFYNKAARFLPVTIALTLKEHNLPWPSTLPRDLWELLNIRMEDLPALLFEVRNHQVLIEKNAPSNLGDRGYWKKVAQVFGEEVPDPAIIVPSTAHYSWSKSAHLFGIGRENCLQVKLDQELCMSMLDLRSVLSKCLKERRPIIQIVCVLGSTEFGSFDRLDEIMHELGEWRKKGLYTPVHIDAAYGGYFKTMFEEGERFKETAGEARHSEPILSKVFAAISQTDSITVDPHKLGHTPYGAGVFITRHGFSKEFVSENADYCLTTRGPERDENFPLGKYILEGSKPGASATAVYFSNQIIPLNSDGYGGLLLEMIRKARLFYQKLLLLNEEKTEFSQKFEIKIVMRPHSNLVCFYVRPRAMTKLSCINEFNSQLIQHYFPRPTNHIQDFDYFISKTRLRRSKLMPDCAEKLFGDLENDEDSLQLIRLVFLNQWTDQKNSEGVSYMDDFLTLIKATCLELSYED